MTRIPLRVDAQVSGVPIELSYAGKKVTINVHQHGHYIAYRTSTDQQIFNA